MRWSWRTKAATWPPRTATPSPSPTRHRPLRHRPLRRRRGRAPGRAGTRREQTSSATPWRSRSRTERASPPRSRRRAAAGTAPPGRRRRHVRPPAVTRTALPRGERRIGVPGGAAAWERPVALPLRVGRVRVRTGARGGAEVKIPPSRAGGLSPSAVPNGMAQAVLPRARCAAARAVRAVAPGSARARGVARKGVGWCRRTVSPGVRCRRLRDVAPSRVGPGRPRAGATPPRRRPAGGLGATRRGAECGPRTVPPGVRCLEA